METSTNSLNYPEKYRSLVIFWWNHFRNAPRTKRLFSRNSPVDIMHRKTLKTRIQIATFPKRYAKAGSCSLGQLTVTTQSNKIFQTSAVSEFPVFQAEKCRIHRQSA